MENPIANTYFIAIYTHEVKDYCDLDFFENVHILSKGRPVYVVDNSPGDVYHDKLDNLFRAKGFREFHLHRVRVPEHPLESQFQRNVCYSVNYLRDLFLSQTNLPYFLILESDVLPPADLLRRLESTLGRLDRLDPSWGIVGGLYYSGFHNYNFDTSRSSLERTHHCLSGCTVYKRELIEKYPFRYDPADLGPFPDAFICYDAGQEYSLWNEHRIHCRHLHNAANGLRVR